MILKTNNKLIVFDINNYSSSKDMYKTIDMVLHKLKTQLNKVKDKMTAHH